jgi:predicted NBD/HSP70 family sugar kinase
MRSSLEAGPGGADDRGFRLRPRGSTQGGLRQYNERVVLQALRLHGPLSSADLARLTQLTAQTISQIGKRLLDEKLLLKEEPVRGKVGQPSVPLALNPDGAFAIGVEVGRNSLDVILIDFTGAVRARSSLAYPVPEPSNVVPEIRARLGQVMLALTKPMRRSLIGIGIAAPLSLGGWRGLLGMPESSARQWEEIDLRLEIQKMVDVPVSLLKDTAAACVAELVAGGGRDIDTFLYLFVDTFIGGGLVVDSHLRGGLHGNAGAVGSLASRIADTESPPQLLTVASLLMLEQKYRDAGLDGSAALDERALREPWAAITRDWIDEAGNAIAFAAQSACCFLDLRHIIIDGCFSRPLLQRLLASTVKQMGRYNWEGVTRPELQMGKIGSDARALGGALLPLYLEFAPDRDLFLKILEEPGAAVAA